MGCGHIYICPQALRAAAIPAAQGWRQAGVRAHVDRRQLALAAVALLNDLQDKVSAARRHTYGDLVDALGWSAARSSMHGAGAGSDCNYDPMVQRQTSTRHARHHNSRYILRDTIRTVADMPMQTSQLPLILTALSNGTFVFN